MARFFHNVPGPATELPSSTNWKTHVITTLDPVPFARIIVFKPPPAETFFGLVRVENSAELLIWDVYDTEEMPATGRYIGLVPPDCVIQLKKVMVKFVDLTSGGSA